MLRPSGLKVPTKILKPGTVAVKTPAAGKAFCVPEPRRDYSPL